MVIGTAGHVDHGKTVLVKALTGVDTDRLPDEKRRGISIDLGFARFTLPGGRPAAIVDVPGHERFIRNMLAGVTGIDLVMLVVAADEGVMPQTREHLAIVSLLEVGAGCVVITKCDLVDGEWLDLVEEEVRDAVRGTFLEGAPVVRVSAVTGQGLDALLEALEGLADRVRPRDDRAFARLPVDRVFSVAGFGTVVTGTLVTGSVRRDDRLELLPAGLEVRVRGVQVHEREVERAVAGHRVALNLSGAERSAIRRGDVLATPGVLRPTTVFEGRLHLLPDCPRPIATRTRVRLHTGTAEVLGRLVILEGDRLEPGQSGLVRFRSETPLAVVSGDHFIIRHYSPVVTAGGGAVIEPHPRRRSRAVALKELRLKERGGPAELILALLERDERPASPGDLAQRLGLLEELVAEGLAALGAQGGVSTLAGGLVVAGSTLTRYLDRVRAVLQEYHRQYPLRRGVPKEELKGRALRALDARAYDAVLGALQTTGTLRVREGKVALAGFEPAADPAVRDLAARVEDAFRRGGTAPPSVEEALAEARSGRGPSPGVSAEELLAHLVEEGRLVRLATDLYLHPEGLERAREAVARYISAHGPATTSQLREAMGTSRKFAVPILEHLDAIRWTRRVGDRRVLATRSG